GEIHHSAKKDAPSGTLKKIAEEMRANGYTRAVNLGCNRAGVHPGTHEIGFDSAADTITLRHTARSRESFARGALRAARWVVGKKGLFELCKGKVPVLGGAGGYNTSEVILLACELAALGVDGILSVTPYYNKPTQEGLFQHYRAIAEAVSLPIILYSVQGRTGVNIETAT